MDIDLSKNDQANGVFLRERRTLTALALSIVDNHSIAEEVVQESWLRWRRRQYPVNKAQPILVQIVKNLSIDWLRRQKTERFGLEQLPAFIDNHPDTERVVIARQQLTLVIEALLALPDRTLQAFRMRRIDGLTYRDIGKRLAVSEATAFRMVGDALLHVALAIEQAES